MQAVPGHQKHDQRFAGDRLGEHDPPPTTRRWARRQLPVSIHQKPAPTMSAPQGWQRGFDRQNHRRRRGAYATLRRWSNGSATADIQLSCRHCARPPASSAIKDVLSTARRGRSSTRSDTGFDDAVAAPVAKRFPVASTGSRAALSAPARGGLRDVPVALDSRDAALAWRAPGTKTATSLGVVALIRRAPEPSRARPPEHKRVRRRFQPLGTDRQLALMVHTGTPSGIVGCAANRSGPDFTEDDLELAAVLEPLLIALYRSTYRTPIAQPCSAAPSHPVHAAQAFRARDSDHVLGADGMAATVIAHKAGNQPQHGAPLPGARLPKA
ncbi:MAG: hypothetical protein QOJ11_3485 [Frankiales bacterium]|jgi:hypothetical protein|nr:hypothetical protein [Frankiales bacterium]